MFALGGLPKSLVFMLLRALLRMAFSMAILFVGACAVLCPRAASAAVQDSSGRPAANTLVPAADEATSDEPWFRIDGAARISADYYSMEPDPAGTVSARRPANLYRLLFAPTMHLGDLRIPVTFLLSTDQTNVTTPRVAEQNLSQFLENPMNRISIAPSYQWATVYLGHHVPQYSELSTGDIQLFGAGFDLSPGDFQLAAFHGIAQRAAESTTPAFAASTYERQLTTLRLAYGSPDAARVGLNLVRMRDDSNSVANTDGMLRAESGLLLSLTGDLRFADAVTVKSELAASAFTRDQSAPLSGNEALDAFEDVFDIRESTYGDIAAALSVGLDFDDWGVETRARFLGPGYEPLGFPYVQSDNLEVTLAPRLRLLDGALDFSSSVGLRFNNITDTASPQTRQLLASANLLVQISPDLMVSANYTNFGFRSDVDDFNVRRVDMISHSLAISPLINIPTERLIHQLSATFAYDDFNDGDVLLGALNSSTTRSVFANYTAQFLSIPLSAGIGFNNMVSRPDSLAAGGLGSSSLDVNSLHGSLSYRLFEGMLTPTFKLTYSSSSIGAFTADKNLLLRLGLRYRPARSLTLSLTGSLKLYEYGSARPDVSYKENFIQTALSTTF